MELWELKVLLKERSKKQLTQGEWSKMNGKCNSLSTGIAATTRRIGGGSREGRMRE
jgi:hypothetical protein